MSDDPFSKVQGYHDKENEGVFSKSTLVRLPLSPGSFGEIFEKLRRANYNVMSVHGIDMTGFQVCEAKSLPPSATEIIARIAHEINRAYCAAIGDHSQLPWESAPDWQRESAIKGVEFVMTNGSDPSFGPHRSHESWCWPRPKNSRFKIQFCMSDPATGAL